MIIMRIIKKSLFFILLLNFSNLFCMNYLLSHEGYCQEIDTFFKQIFHNLGLYNLKISENSNLTPEQKYVREIIRYCQNASQFSSQNSDSNKILAHQLVLRELFKINDSAKLIKDIEVLLENYPFYPDVKLRYNVEVFSSNCTLPCAKFASMTSDSKYTVCVSQNYLGSMVAIDLWEKDSTSLVPRFIKSVILSELISSISISFDNKYLAVGCKDGKILILDLQDGSLNELERFSTNKKIGSVAWSKKDYYLAIGSQKKCEVYDLDPICNGKEYSDIYPLVSFSVNGYYFKSLEFGSDNSYIICLSYDQSGSFLNLYDITNNKTIDLLSGKEAVIEGVSLSQDGKYLVSIINYDIVLFDLSDIKNINKIFKIKEEYESRVENPLTSIKLSNDGNYIICGTYNGKIKILTLSADKKIIIFTTFSQPIETAVNDSRVSSISSNYATYNNLGYFASVSGDKIKFHFSGLLTNLDFQDLTQALIKLKETREGVMAHILIRHIFENYKNTGNPFEITLPGVKKIVAQFPRALIFAFIKKEYVVFGQKK